MYATPLGYHKTAILFNTHGSRTEIELQKRKKPEEKGTESPYHPFGRSSITVLGLFVRGFSPSDEGRLLLSLFVCLANSLKSLTNNTASSSSITPISSVHVGQLILISFNSIWVQTDLLAVRRQHVYSHRSLTLLGQPYCEYWSHDCPCRTLC